MIAILGDIHFSSARDYFIEIGQKIIEWFANWSYNKKGNELILAGDIVHSAVNGGLVINMIEQLVISSRFDTIHIIPGNHDVKRRDGVVQLAYEFLRSRPCIKIYDRLTDTVIQGKRVLMLPHYIPNGNEVPMTELYSNLHKTHPEAYDLVVGHFIEETMAFGASDAVKNISKLKTRHLCLGHLHTRANPNIYIGSVYANKINEADSSRAAWIIDDSCSKIEDPLPIFCEYQTVQYPEMPVYSNALVRVLTITNCTNERLARMQYGKDIFIRKLVHTLDSKKTDDTQSSDRIQELDPVQLFRDFIKNRSTVIDRNVAMLCMSLLKKGTNLTYDNGSNSAEVL